jgi:hypothetical protein
LEAGIRLAHEPLGRLSSGEKSAKAPWTLCICVNEKNRGIDFIEKCDTRDETMKSMLPPTQWFSDFVPEFPCSAEKKVI